MFLLLIIIKQPRGQDPRWANDLLSFWHDVVQVRGHLSCDAISWCSYRHTLLWEQCEHSYTFHLHVLLLTFRNMLPCENHASSCRTTTKKIHSLMFVHWKCSGHQEKSVLKDCCKLSAAASHKLLYTTWKATLWWGTRSVTWWLHVIAIFCCYVYIFNITIIIACARMCVHEKWWEYPQSSEWFCLCDKLLHGHCTAWNDSAPSFSGTRRGEFMPFFLM